MLLRSLFVTTCSYFTTSLWLHSCYPQKSSASSLPVITEFVPQFCSTCSAVDLYDVEASDFVSTVKSGPWWILCQIPLCMHVLFFKYYLFIVFCSGIPGGGRKSKLHSRRWKERCMKGFFWIAFGGLLSVLLVHHSNSWRWIISP